MRSSLLAGMSAGLLLCCGCQSTSWTAKNKKEVEPAVAQAKPVRDIPWSEWRKKKGSSDEKSPLPAELQAKLDKANGNSDSTKTAAEWVAEGNQLEVGRNFAAATKAYESALQLDPIHADAHHRLGIMADMRQEYGTARDHYEAALRQKPHDANLLSDFGYSLHLQGNPRQSERYLLQSLDVDPQHKQALKNLVTLYATQNRYEDAAQVCRRLRPAAEAQRMLDQGFPKGRAIPDEESVELASNRNLRDSQPGAAPPDVAQPSLKNKSVEEVYQLMAKERQAGIQARQEKSIKELRPSFQESMSEDDWDQSHKPDITPKSSQFAWAENSPAAAPQPIIRPGRSASRPEQSPTEEFAANNRPASDSVTLWNGASLKAQPDASPARQNPQSWATDESSDANPAATQVESADTANPGRMVAQSSANLRAYQLGMSAGPGTMFPVLATDAAGSWRTERTVTAPAVEQAPATVGLSPQTSSGSQWSTDTTPRGYSETRAAGPTETSSESADSMRRQFTPVEVAPRSPTDNWESPSTMPWPERAALKPQQDQRPDSPPSRVIPGSWKTPNDEPDRAATSYASGSDRATSQRPDRAPAWFDSARQDTRSAPGTNNANTIQKWPYAPQ